MDLCVLFSSFGLAQKKDGRDFFKKVWDPHLKVFHPMIDAKKIGD